MRHSLHSHIIDLENRIQTLRDRLTSGRIAADEVGEIEQQLANCELALEYYRQAYALEVSLSDPKMPGGATGESDGGAGGPGRLGQGKKSRPGSTVARVQKAHRASLRRRPRGAAGANAARICMMCAVIGFLSLSACEAKSQQLTNSPQDGQPYFIVSASNSGLCWDLRTQDLFGDAPSARVQQFNCAGTQNQVFKLTPASDAPVRGARLILTQYGGDFPMQYVDAVPAQVDLASGVYAYKIANYWGVQPGSGNNAVIQHLPDNQCVERPNTSDTGIELFLRPCNGNPNQQWVFQQVTDVHLLRKLRTKRKK
jgi:hypothetical protein